VSGLPASGGNHGNPGNKIPFGFPRFRKANKGKSWKSGWNQNDFQDFQDFAKREKEKENRIKNNIKGKQ
jgi:hypothetical protein